MTTAALATNGRATVSLAKRGLRQALRRPQFLAPLVIFPSLMLAANTGGAGRATELPGFPEVHGFLDFELAGAMMQSTMLAGVRGAGLALLDHRRTRRRHVRPRRHDRHLVPRRRPCLRRPDPGRRARGDGHPRARLARRG